MDETVRIILIIIISVSIFGLFYHAMNGIRHIFWDFGFFLNRSSTLISGIVVVSLTFMLSVLLIYKLGIFS